MTVPDQPRDRLVAVVSDLAGRLEREQPELLALPRFEAERAALERLRDPTWVARAAAACNPAEAERIADLVAARWAGLGGADSADPGVV